MPYIIETRDAAEPPNQHIAVRFAVKSRRAVATLEEARKAAHNVMSMPATDSTLDALMDARRAIDALSEAGGTVGPLPDGTVIEVTRES